MIHNSTDGRAANGIAILWQPGGVWGRVGIDVGCSVGMTWMFVSRGEPWKESLADEPTTEI